MQVCPVCSKRWGEEKVGADVEITRCDEHASRLSTAEIYAKGWSVGNYDRAERMKGIKRKNGRAV